MIVACKACGAELRMNRNLAGTTVSCPECGERVKLPDQAPARRSAPQSAQKAPATRRTASPPRAPMSLSLLGAQTALFLLAASCFFGAFLQRSWNPPASSYLACDPMLLVVVGVFLVLAMAMAVRFPIVSTLGVVVLILVACAIHYRLNRTIDASRVLALSLAMVALWLGMEHRGVT